MLFSSKEMKNSGDFLKQILEKLKDYVWFLKIKSRLKVWLLGEKIIDFSVVIFEEKMPKNVAKSTVLRLFSRRILDWSFEM